MDEQPAPRLPGRPAARQPHWRVWVLRLVAVAFLAATAAIVWLGYRATEEWSRSTELLVDRTMQEVVTLLGTALTRDIRGAHASLLPIGYEQVAPDPPYDMADASARIFARFPYPESVFIWRRTADGACDIYFFNRTDRPPPWASPLSDPNPFPVVTLADPPSMRPLIASLVGEASVRRRLLVLDTEIGGVRYQVVARMLHERTNEVRLVAMIGFLVNMPWAEREYFSELLQQVRRIGDGTGTYSLSILDESGRTVATTAQAHPSSAGRERSFPMVFFDLSAAWSSPPGYHLEVPIWRARVDVADRAVLAAATTGARRTLVLICIAAVVLMVALFLSARAIHTTAAVTTMKWEFISTVTHELKTPLASIRLIGQTLARRRYPSADTIPKYALLLEREAVRLTRMVNNLLAFARTSDVRRLYAPVPLHLVDLVDDVLEIFGPALVESDADVQVDIPPDLPALLGDRTAMLAVFENVIDNAVKYSEGPARIAILAEANGRNVHVWVTDKGTGIAREDLRRVFDKFFRGRNARSWGSGLGLAIARQIVEDHGGQIEIASMVGTGTRVHISLPAGAVG